MKKLFLLQLVSGFISTIILLLVSLAILLVCTAVTAHAQDSLNPMDYTDYLLNTDQNLTIDDMNNPEVLTLFIPLPSNNMNLGFTSASIWLRIKPPTGDLMLEVASAILDYITIYKPNGIGGYSTLQVGEHHPFSNREFDYHNPLFSLNSDSPQVFYLHINSSGSVQIPLRLWSPKKFAINSSRVGHVSGLYLGVMLVMILYNLFLFFSTVDRNYLRYSLYISIFLLFQGSLSGYTFQYLWPDSPLWAGKSAAFFAGLTILTALNFTRHFLTTWDIVPYLDRVMKVLMLGSVCIMV